MILAGGQATHSAYVEEGSNKMASIRMIPEEEAIGKTKDIYEEIKTELGIDFVPNLYKVMASKPGYLEANWNRVKAVMVEPGKLDRLTKEIIAVAVSAVNVCGY
jgi:alkylhydroperoxidase family enzyme